MRKSGRLNGTISYTAAESESKICSLSLPLSLSLSLSDSFGRSFSEMIPRSWEFENFFFKSKNKKKVEEENYKEKSKKKAKNFQVENELQNLKRINEKNVEQIMILYEWEREKRVLNAFQTMNQPSTVLTKNFSRIALRTYFKIKIKAEREKKY